METYSTWLIIKSMQIKTQGGITSPLSEWPSSERSTNNKCFRSWIQEGIFLHSWWGCNGCSHCGKQHSVQFSSVTQSCPTPCDPIYCSTPDLPVHHQLLEPTQTHVHQVGDATQPFHPLLSPSPALNLPSIRVSSSESVLRIRWPKYWSFSISPFNEYSGLIFLRIDWLDVLAIQGTASQCITVQNITVQKYQFFSVQLSL